MALRDYCSPDAIDCDLDAADKEDALRQLVDLLAASGAFPKTKISTIRNDIIERERRASTGIGNGVGVPHARTGAVKKIALAIGRVPDGIDFGAVDGDRVRVILLMVSPEDSTDEHLAAMKAIVTMVRDPYQCRRLLSCESPESFLDLIEENDAASKK